MTGLEAINLGFVQGLTEFLPISSSGHLGLFQEFMGFETPPVTFDVLLHGATLLAVIIFFREQLLKLFSQVGNAVIKPKEQPFPSLVVKLAVATLPAVIVGLILESELETLFGSVQFFPIGFGMTALLLFWASKHSEGHKSLDELTLKDSLVIGLFQALAILPSISRSGSTIAAALLIGVQPKAAFNFSFLLSIPAILGAVVIELPEITDNLQQVGLSYFVGIVAAFVSGWMALKVLRSVLVNRKLAYFSLYLLLLASALVFFYR
jgi:undecaprenyl-diphosphatase